MKKEEIYEKLLQNLEKDKDKLCPSDMESQMAKYYYKTIEDNCYYKPHNKLGKNTNAIYSSAMMIYNLLGNEVTLNKKDYQVQYEEELEAITPGKGRFETHKAHLDASLKREDEIIFCEAKMTEWFGSPKTLAEAYLDEECYLNITDNKKEFIKFFKELVDINTLSNGRYKSKYKRYDAIQMTIHILGIYNFVKSNKNGNIKNISLINCVWGYDEIEQYLEEKEEAKEFIEKANIKFKPIFIKLGIEFNIEYYSFHELKNLIDFSKDSEKLEYLKRYDISL